MSLAIFISDTAMTFSAPDISTSASCAASASNLFSAVTKGRPVILATSSAKRSAKPTRLLRPVPTAVPPWASWYRRGNAPVTRAMPFSTCLA